VINDDLGIQILFKQDEAMILAHKKIENNKNKKILKDRTMKIEVMIIIHMIKIHRMKLLN
jgi:hypothetical protein